MRYTVTDASAPVYSDVVSTADLKAFLRVEHSEEDTLIEAMREAAILHIENITNLRIGDRAVSITYEDVYSKFEIPVGPVSATGFTLLYRTSASSSVQLVKDTDYYLDHLRKPAQVSLINVPNVYDYSFYKLNVVATVGYTEATVPAAIVHAIKLLVAHMYELRQPEIVGTITTQVKLGLDALLNPYRIVSFR